MERFERLSPPKKTLTEKQIMADEKDKFFDLVKKLHVYYRDQLSAALIAVNKFKKSNKYFIRALREISPMSSQDVPVLTFRDLEKDYEQYKERHHETSPEEDVISEVVGNILEVRTASTRASSSRRSLEDDANSEYKAHCNMFETFFKNIHNFRLFRQHVKINIVGKLLKVPKNVNQTEMQKRTQGELEALLSAWTSLLDRNSNILRLVHPDVREQAENLFDSELEVAYYTGVLSVLPKLTDIANKLEFALTKYEMSANGF